MAAPRPRIFTIPASAPFLPTLIEALVEGRLVPGFPDAGDPLALAKATVYLPTRRACRLAQEVFLQVVGGNAVVLPRLVPLGGVDEDELAFAEAAVGVLAQAGLDLPPALGNLERTLLLSQLVLKWAESPELRATGNTPLVARSPAAALALAEALARLIDDVTTRKVRWERLDGLVPDHVDQYWQLTLKFLQIARDLWPEILRERGAIEPAARRDLLLAAEAERLGRVDGPVIAAGSTASMPATAELLATISRLPHGAVVLPGLDGDLDNAAWEMIAADSADNRGPAVGHPQFAMHSFLAQLGLARDEVVPLVAAAPHGRERIASEALRPAAATDRWSERLPDADLERALAGVAVIAAANPEEEALAIALALREAIEQPTATAALVTPDRALARRVVAALGRWAVEVDDSGGDALADTPAGVFARLAAEAALGGLAPAPLLALLKHPLLRLGGGDGGLARTTAALECALLRGPRPRPGTDGLAHALAALRHNRSALHGADPRLRITEEQFDSVADLVSRLSQALRPLEKLPAGAHSLAQFAACHRQVVEELAADGSGTDGAYSGEDWASMIAALEEVAASPAAAQLAIAQSDYAELCRSILADKVVRRPGLQHARVRIFGLLEARLQTVDRVVLGGLVEGTWPPQTRSDPWLSRPMRHELGLDLPERRIGLTAHDFAQALGAAEVVLSHATKVGGAPTVPSRFLLRLQAVCGEERWKQAVARGTHYVALARTLDRPARIEPIKRPEPCPPRAARPLRLSVTEIEHWLRDPYTIYAKHILSLTPLDAVDAPLGAADRGSAIHNAIGAFTEKFAGRLPDDPLGELLRLGREQFAPLTDFPEAVAFWWPRFERVARWFVGWETERRAALTGVHAEIRGEIKIPLGERTFRLVARADRIERYADGSYAVLDYKTGQVPTEKQVRIGLSPQLTLESAILRGGGFGGIAAGSSVAEITYVALKGGEPAGEPKTVSFKEGTPDQQADLAFTRLVSLLQRFESEQQPYRSLVSPMWSTRYGDYDHLARVKEWSAGEAGAGEA
jgi:ATP-dependent helicase/nuclease subunit B